MEKEWKMLAITGSSAANSRPRASLLPPAILFLFLLLPHVLAVSALDQKAQELSAFAADLNADIRVQNVTLNDTTVRFMVWGTVRNTGQTDWQLHLISNHPESGGWKYEQLLGVLQPGSSYNLTEYFEARYSGQAHASTQYALVASGDVVAHGEYFELSEDWTPYITRTRQQLTDMAMLFVPLAGGVIVVLIVLLAEWGYASTAPEEAGGEAEYNLRTLLLPDLHKASFWTVLANALSHPLAWLVELGALGAMAILLQASLSSRMGDGSAAAVWLISLAGAALMPLLYFVLAWAYNEMVERMPLRFMAGMFMWGIAAATLALVLNTVQMQLLGALLDGQTMLLAVLTIALVAPLTEELLKGLGLLAIRAHHEFADAMHGLHLGFAAGVGFAFVENWFYLASRTDPLQSGLGAWLGLALYRSLFNVLAHGSFSAVLGAALGWSKSQAWGRILLLVFISGVVMATILHSLFNLTAISDSFQAISADFPVFGFNPLMTLTLAAMLAVLAWAATLDYRRRMKEARAKARRGQ